PWVPQLLSTPTAMERSIPHARHGRKAYRSRHGLPSPVLDRCPRRRIWKPEVLARHLLRGLRRWSCAALAAAVTVGVGGCGNTDSWVDASPAQGWPAQYGDAANSSYTATSGATKLSLQWTRSVKG